MSIFRRTNTIFTQSETDYSFSPSLNHVQLTLEREFLSSYTPCCAHTHQKTLKNSACKICSGWAFTPAHLHLCKDFSHKWGGGYAFTPYFMVVVLPITHVYSKKRAAHIKYRAVYCGAEMIISITLHLLDKR